MTDTADELAVMRDGVAERLARHEADGRDVDNAGRSLDVYRAAIAELDAWIADLPDDAA